MTQFKYNLINHILKAYKIFNLFFNEYQKILKSTFIIIFIF